MSAEEIHHKLCAFGLNITSGGTLKQCCKMFKDGR
jgi:hypothetical protein